METLPLTTLVIPEGRLDFSAAAGFQQQVEEALASAGTAPATVIIDCTALDYYGTFYLQLQDERLCAGRDAVHSRIGGSCTIDHFQQLIPKLRR